MKHTAEAEDILQESFVAVFQQIASEKSVKNELPVYGASIKGTINGDGVDLILTAEYGKIYLRKT